MFNDQHGQYKSFFAEKVGENGNALRCLSQCIVRCLVHTISRSNVQSFAIAGLAPKLREIASNRKNYAQ